jgi:acetoin utilization deacetylase AcuC-like enzyme
LIGKALVADCDLHQGNGTAAVFAGDPTVATFSIHQDHIYPMDRPPSTIDIGLMPGTNERAYIKELQRWLLPLFDSHEPDLVVFVAGADPFVEDQLGSLALTKEGLSVRDALIVEACKERNLPLLVVLAGGYAYNFDDTVAIHLETLRQARRLWRAD